MKKIDSELYNKNVASECWGPVDLCVFFFFQGEVDTSTYEREEIREWKRIVETWSHTQFILPNLIIDLPLIALLCCICDMSTRNGYHICKYDVF